MVLCYPPGTPIPQAAVTRGAVEFVSAGQDAASEVAPALGSLAEMRAAGGRGTRYSDAQAPGLLFLRLRQAAGWGGGAPTGYCPPGGCSWAVVSLPGGAAAAPAAAECEARLAAEPGGAPSDTSSDAFLAATVAPSRFDLAAACPALPQLPMCGCWGWVGCGNRECTSQQSQACDAR